MQITHMLKPVPPFEVGPDPLTVVDYEGSVIARTPHLFISEAIANMLNKDEVWVGIDLAETAVA